MKFVVVVEFVVDMDGVEEDWDCCSRKAAELMDATGKGIASTSAWAV